MQTLQSIDVETVDNVLREGQVEALRTRWAQIAHETLRSAVKFLGHTRFSVDSFNSRSFAATRKEVSKEKYLEWLYDPERLRPRLQIFCEESIPQIARAIGDFDVRHVVSFSPSLPAYAKKELEEIAAAHSFVLLNETDSQVGTYLASPSVAKQVLDWTEGNLVRAGVYRLDDDDILPADYFARMKPYLEVGQVGWRVSLANGFTALRSRGVYYYARENYQAMASVGLLAIMEITEAGNIVGARDYSHTKTDRYQPVILDSRGPGFFRTRHRTQDNAIGAHSSAYPVEIFEQLRRYPRADLEKIHEYFPALAGKVFLEPENSQESVKLLPGPITVTQAPIPFFVPFRRGATLRARLAEGRTLQPNSLLVRLRLRQTNGSPIDEQSARKPLTDMHIRNSVEHGFYTPFWHGEEGESRHCLIKMPEGLEILGAELVAGNKGPVEIESLDAYQLPGDDASGDNKF